MKSFQFSLAKMRSYKEQVLEKEKTTLRQLQAEKTKIETDIENLEFLGLLYYLSLIIRNHRLIIYR